MSELSRYRTLEHASGQRSSTLSSLCRLASLLLHARFGRTVGKKLLRVKVLDIGGAVVPSLRQAFLRDIGLVVLNTATVAYVIYLVFTVGYTSDGEVAGLPGELIM